MVGSNLWAALGWLFAIIALIPLSLWLLRRSPLGGAGLGPVGTPRTVAALPLGAQHKLVTVEVGDGEDRLWLVLGVGPQGISNLHTLRAHTAPGEPATPLPPAATFANLLQRLRQDPRGNDAR